MTDELRPSYQQEPFWFLHRLHPGDSAYHIAFALDLEGDLDEAALEAALADVVAAQDCLRMSMTAPLGRARLHVAAPGPVQVDRPTSPTSQSEAEGFVEELVNRPFALNRPPLYRFGLVTSGRGTTATLTCVFHHVVFDGASVELFIGQLFDAYRARVEGAASPLRAPDVPYADYVAKQAASMTGEGAVRARAYWQRQLADSSILELPADGPRAEGAFASGGATIRRRLHAGLRDALESFARSRGLTPFMVLLAGFEAMLARHAETEDVAVAIPVSLRMDPAIRRRIGLFVNTTVIRARLEDDLSFEDWALRIREACLGAYRHHHLPFVQVVQAVAPARGLGHNPLFSAMFILQSPPRFEPPPRLRVRHRELAPRGSKFDLTGSIAVDAEGYELSLEYRDDLFSAETMVRMAERFERLMTEALARPTERVFALPLATAEEMRRIDVWSRGRPFPPQTSVRPLPEQVADLAAADPDRVVVIEDGVRTTLGQLDARARRVAASLGARGVGPGSRVGIALDPGADLLAAVFAVWKAGGAHVPIDAELPQARLTTLIDDAQPDWVIVADASDGVLEPELRAREVRLGDLEAEGGPLAPSSVGPDDLAYIIYTSGSTGRPKGVEVTHEGLARSLGAFLSDLALPEGSTWTALSTLSFDISVIELFGPLVGRGIAVVPPRSAGRDGPALAAWLDRHRPTLLQTTPTRWRMLLAAGWRGHPDLVALSGGEVLSVGLARELLARSARLANVYGPTEGTVWASFHRVEPSELEGLADGASLTVGPALPGMRLYVLDRGGRSSPIGVPGEIHLAGPQLSRGYVGDPDKTSAVFVERPHVGETRTYATGDRGRFQDDGALEFLGRSDAQVKVRGHRVELAEVEAHLRGFDEVNEVAVALRGDRLVAFVVPALGSRPSTRALRTRLLELLPEHMVPASVTLLEALPRTPSGKLDRRALPEAVREPEATGGEPPADLLELQIAKIWQEVLRVSTVRRNDDFFELGGQSILAVELAARLESALQHRVTVMDLFRARTVGALAELVRSGGIDVPGRTLIAHRPMGSRPPLITIGAGLMMNGLLRHLDPEVPLFSLNLFGLVPDEGELPWLTIEQIATAYVEDLRRAAPTGPYQLLGYCADTKVALEVARLLEADGEQVGFFGAIDVIGDVSEVQFRPRQALGLLRDFGLAYPRGLINRRIRSFRSAALRTSSRLAGWVDRVVLRELTKQQRHDIVYARYLQALAQHTITPFSGEVSFFICSEYYRQTNERVIRGLAGGHARVFEVPGFHETLFESPSVEVLGEQLSRALLPAP